MRGISYAILINFLFDSYLGAPQQEGKKDLGRLDWNKTRADEIRKEEKLKL